MTSTTPKMVPRKNTNTICVVLECMALNMIEETTTAKAVPYFFRLPSTIPRKTNSSANAGTIAIAITLRTISSGVCDEISISPA